MYISSTNSTNTLVREMIAGGWWPEGERFLRTDFQTAGRGQAGNGWESQSGRNLLCSVLIDISRLPSDHSPFYLNVAVSVAVHRLAAQAVQQHSGLTSNSAAVSIKWPNDIYWNDMKIAGILIENAIIGSEVKYSIAGIGLNVNQSEWKSDAPNPVSLKQITGREFDLDGLMQGLLDELDKVLAQKKEEIWNYYKAHLYRREGFWPFVEREVSVEPTMNATAAFSRQHSAVSFMARIKDVLQTGEIVLQDEHGRERKYHFKQIRYVVK